MGLIRGAGLTPASTPERAGARELLSRGLPWFAWLQIRWVDGGCTGLAFAPWAGLLRRKLQGEVVRRSDQVKGLPWRWGGADLGLADETTPLGARL